MEEKLKKPLYKRVWFWILILFVGIPAVTKITDHISDAVNPAERIVNEEWAAEQARAFEEAQAAQAAQQADTLPEGMTVEETIKASIEAYVSETFRGEHYSCEVEPTENGFQYAATLSVEVPADYADDPDTILTGLANTIGSQADSRLAFLKIVGYYQGEMIYGADGYFPSRATLDNDPPEKYTGATTTTTASESYIVNTDTNKFHRGTCSYADSIAQEHKSYFSGSRTAAINSGYSPCGHCDP